MSQTTFNLIDSLQDSDVQLSEMISDDESSNKLYIIINGEDYGIIPLERILKDNQFYRSYPIPSKQIKKCINCEVKDSQSNSGFAIPIFHSQYVIEEETKLICNHKHTKFTRYICSDCSETYFFEIHNLIQQNLTTICSQQI